MTVPSTQTPEIRSLGVLMNGPDGLGGKGSGAEPVGFAVAGGDTGDCCVVPVEDVGVCCVVAGGDVGVRCAVVESLVPVPLPVPQAESRTTISKAAARAKFFTT